MNKLFAYSLLMIACGSFLIALYNALFGEVLLVVLGVVIGVAFLITFVKQVDSWPDKIK